jgi:hypothetical protein
MCRAQHHPRHALACTSDNSIGQNKRHSRYGMSRRQQHYRSSFLCLANCRDQLMNGLVCTHAEIAPLSVQNLYSFDCISSPPSSFCVGTSVFSNSQTYFPTYQGHAFFPSTNTAALLRFPPIQLGAAADCSCLLLSQIKDFS